MLNSNNRQFNMLFNFQILDREKDSRRGKQAREKLYILKNFCTNFKPHTSSKLAHLTRLS